MPLHHSWSTAQLWCGTVLHNNRQFYYISVEYLLCYLILFLHFNVIIATVNLHENKTKTKQPNCIKTSFILWLKKFFMTAEWFIYLCVYSCLLAFRCVSLSIQQSGSPDLGYSAERQLLTTIKLTRADMTVLLFHTVQCLWSGHVEGRHTGTTEKYT